MTDEQLRNFWAFGKAVADVVPGETIEAGATADGFLIFSTVDGIEYHITVEPHRDVASGKYLLIDP
jgi:hypothetical protein